MFDADVDVARDAIRSAARLGAGDFLFVPPLVSLLRNRLLKGAAREVLAGYGEDVVPDARLLHEGPRRGSAGYGGTFPPRWRRIPGQASLQALLDGLEDSDGFLRYKALSALEHLRRNQPELAVPPATVEKLIAAETGRAFDRLTLHYNLFHAGGLEQDSLLARALTEKYERAIRPRLHAARPGAPARRHRGGATRAHDRRRPGAIERGGVPRQHPARRRPPQGDAARRGHATRRARAQGQLDLPHPAARRRGHARTARPRRQPGGGGHRDSAGGSAKAVVAGRRSRARARAPAGQGLVGVRGGVVGAGRAAHAAGAASGAVAGAAARRRAGRPPAPDPALRLRVGRRALPRRQPRPAGAPRNRSHAGPGGSGRRRPALHPRRAGGVEERTRIAQRGRGARRHQLRGRARRSPGARRRPPPSNRRSRSR